MKKFYLLFSLLLTLVLVAGCGKSNVITGGGAYIAYDIAVDPQTWDPSYNTANDGGHIITNMFEGLYRATATGVVPAGASTTTISSDGLTYTFDLNKKEKWSNGKPVTANDYKFAWLRVLDPTDPSQYSYIMSPYIVGADDYMAGTGTKDAVGIKVLNDYKLEVDLTMPVPYFTQLLSFMTYMPVYSQGTYADGWEKDASTAISNGPFEFVSYTIGSDIQLKKNPNYANADQVKVAGLDFKIIDNATTAVAAYKAGQLQVIDAVPAEQIADLLATDANFNITSQVGTYYYVFNMDDPLVGDPAGAAGVEIRRALSMGIDRQAIVANVTKAGEIPATTFLPPTLTWSNGTSCNSESYGLTATAQVDAAKTLLDKGIADYNTANPSTPITINTLADHLAVGFNTTATDSHKNIAAAIQEQWKTNLGLVRTDGKGITLTQEEWNTFLTDRTQGKFPIAREGWLGDYPDPNTMLDLFTATSGNNDAQWRSTLSDTYNWDTTTNPENATYDALIAKAFTDTGTARDQDFKDAEKILVQTEALVIPVYYYNNENLINNDQVQGVVRTQMGQWYFGDASWK